MPGLFTHEQSMLKIMVLICFFSVFVYKTLLIFNPSLSAQFRAKHTPLTYDLAP